MANPSWTLRILGDFVLERDGEAVDRFGARREEALLAYLAIDPTTPKVRDEIAADLWPGVERRAGLKNISYNMFVMKKRLAAHGLSEPFEDVGNRSLRLSSDIEVDVQDFAEALAAGVSQAGRIGELRRGLALYGGGLLPIYDEPWVKPHQARYEELYQLAIQHMTEALGPTSVQEAMIRRMPTTAWRAVPVVPEVAATVTPASDTRGDIDLVAFAREAEAGLEGAEAERWVAKIEDLYPVIVENFQSAIASEMPGEALEVALGIGRYWVLAGEASEGRRWLERLFHKRESGAALLRARAHHALGRLASLERDDASAIEHLGRALELWRTLDRPDRLVRSLDRLALTYQQSGEMERAAEKLDQVIAIATALGEAEVLAAALYRRALIAMDAQDYLRATALLEERLVTLGADDVAGRAETLAQLALGALGADDLARAEQWGEDAAGLMEGIDAPALRAQIHQVLGRVAQGHGHHDRALTHFQAAIEHARTSQRLSLVGSSMARLALALRDQGETDEAAELYERARNVLVGAGIGRELAQLDAEWAVGA